MKAIRITALVVCIALACPVADSYWKRDYGHGFAGADSLNLSGSPRSMGVGEAFVAMADDIDAIEYNPAGLGMMRWPQLRLWGGWHYVGLDVFRNNIAYGHPVPYVGTLAFSFSYVSYGIRGVQPILDSMGNYLGKFTPRDTLYTFGWGRHIRHGLHLGWQLKYFEQVVKLKPTPAMVATGMTTVSANNKAWLADYGLTWVIPRAGLRLAASFQNSGHYLCRAYGRQFSIKIRWRRFS
jgi:hypothetical protein